MDHLIRIARARQHRAQGIPASGAVARLFSQLPLHRFQRILSLLQGAAGNSSKRACTAKRYWRSNTTWPSADRHRQERSQVTDHPESGLHAHRQFDPVALKAELAHIHRLNGVQQLKGSGAGSGAMAIAQVGLPAWRCASETDAPSNWMVLITRA